MITLINGQVQSTANVPIVPLGYMEMYLNQDAQVVNLPYGQVLGGTRNFIRIYFDANANVETTQPLGGTKQIWSNAELNPQSVMSGEPVYCTWYVVNFYYMNGTRINNNPARWQFTQPASSSVDIGTMTPFLGGACSNYVMITISPQTPTVHTFNTQQFTFTLVGTPTQDVTWTCTGGSISGSGLFTAGGTTGTTFEVTVTSVDNPSAFASAVVTIVGGYDGA